MNCKRQCPKKANRYTGPDKHGNYALSEKRLRFFLDLMVDVSKQEQGNKPSSKKFCCLEELVLKQGMVFNQKQSTTSWGKPFEQALLMALGTEKAPLIAYCEGFALYESRPMPVMTAWAWVADRITVPERGIFIGIPFDPDFALENYLTSGKSGILFSGATSRRLLECGVPTERIVRDIR